MGLLQTYPQNRGVYIGGSFARLEARVSVCSDMRHGVDSARSFTRVHTCLDNSCFSVAKVSLEGHDRTSDVGFSTGRRTIRNACGTSSGASSNRKP